MTFPKVLIGCPVSDYHEYCIQDYLKALKSFTYPNFDILLVDNSASESFSNSLKQQNIPVIHIPYEKNPRDRVVNSRNILRQEVLEGDYDYFLSLEQDVIPPLDVIETALSHKKHILTGVYCGNPLVGNKPRILPLVYKYPSESRKEEAKKLLSSLSKLKKDMGFDNANMVKEYYKIEALEKEPSPTLIHSCGLGCVLIHSSVLKQVKFKYSKEYGGWDDVWFCEDAKLKGFKIYVDPKIKCKHLIQNRPWNWEDLLKNET